MIGMWFITLTATAYCPHGCGWSVTADTTEECAAALGAHITQVHGR